jgi:branched-subunit amino acid transport protein
VSDISAGWIIFGMALINLALRCPLFLVADRIRIPVIIERALAHSPVAVLTAIIVPEALHLGSAPNGAEWFNPDLFATIAAIATSLLTRNLLATIAVGLGAALLLRQVGWFG